MSIPGSVDPGRGVLVPKPKSNIYTVMLALALAAIIIAIVLLCLEMSAYDWDIKATGARFVQATSRPLGATASEETRQRLGVGREDVSAISRIARPTSARPSPPLAVAPSRLRCPL